MSQLFSNRIIAAVAVLLPLIIASVGAGIFGLSVFGAIAVTLAVEVMVAIATMNLRQTGKYIRQCESFDRLSHPTRE